MKYIIYLRVSTQKQDERPQLSRCLEHLRFVHNGEFQYMVCTDKISSRKKFEKREGLQTALNSIREGDILVGMRLDRLARSLSETARIIDILDNRKADVIMVDQPGIKNKVILGTMAGMAEEEVKMIRKRITEKLDDKRSRGERISRYIPYGFKLDMDNLIAIKNQNDSGWTMKPGALLPEPNEQMVLVLMSQLFDMGMSYEKIAQTLASQGYMNRSGKPFQKMSIFRILRRTGRTMSSDQPQEETKFQLFHS